MVFLFVQFFVDPNPGNIGRRHLVVVFDDPLVTDSIQLHPVAASVQVNLTMEILGYIPPIGKISPSWSI